MRRVEYGCCIRAGKGKTGWRDKGRSGWKDKSEGKCGE